ncbi:MAG TPA: polyprenyl diphosphate synthase [Burkholderiaceae bacterium]|nr:polyprenyl diphosphate synthase [Burkholderiaceae bacterium]
MPFTHVSSTIEVPPVGVVPAHIAIVMDGNGRWATRRLLPRTAGHHKGVEAVRRVVEACARQGVKYLTLFAFSSENWRRPAEEVGLLMSLFLTALEREVARLDANGIRLRVVGDLAPFSSKLQDAIAAAQAKTASNNRLTLTIAANYGGRWDILQATRALLRQRPELALNPEALDERSLASYLSMAYAPEPDLFIRTGGEQRISNFLLWQLAYTELYFTDEFWPDFDEKSLEKAFVWYRQRERRFGRTGAQVGSSTDPVAAVATPIGS